MSKASQVKPDRKVTTVLLISGVLAPFVYVGTNIVAAVVYPGYSFTEHSVSELFAIGAPTSRLVVPLSSLSSVLFLSFAFGVWRAAGGGHFLHVLAFLITASGIYTLVHWDFFPMHMPWCRADVCRQDAPDFGHQPLRSIGHCVRSGNVSELVSIRFHRHNCDTHGRADSGLLVRSGGRRKLTDCISWACRARLAIRPSALARRAGQRDNAEQDGSERV